MACEQFLGKNVQDVKNVVLQTLEGHLRSILGADGLTVSQASAAAFFPLCWLTPAVLLPPWQAMMGASSAECRCGSLDCSSPPAARAVLLGVVINEFSVPAVRDV